MGRRNKLSKQKKKAKLMKVKTVENAVDEKYTIDQLLDKAEECMDTFSYELAQKFCQRSLELEPDNVRALEMSGVLLLETENFEAAKQCFGRAIEVCPENGHSKYMYMGQLLTEMDAIACFRKGIELLEKKIANHRETDKEQAESSTESEATQRSLSSAYCSVAEIYLTDACFEEDAEERCRECLEKAVAADSSNPEAHHLQASFFMSVDNQKAAEDSIQKGMSLWLPKLQEAEKAEGAEALDPVQICEVSYPARVNVAKILIELKKYDLSAEVLELLLDEDDAVPEVWYLLGWANYLQGEDSKTTARYYLQKAQKVAVKSHCEDEQLIAHIDELLQELGPGNPEDDVHNDDDDMDLDALDTDSEEETDTQLDTQTDSVHMEH